MTIDRRMFMACSASWMATAARRRYAQDARAAAATGDDRHHRCKELRADFRGTIKALRKIGYTHFGSRLHHWGAAEPEELPASEKAAILRDAGMKIGAVRLSPIVPLSTQIAEAQQLGAHVVVSFPGRIFMDRRHTPTLANLANFMRELGDMGAEVKRAGMAFAYHNHDFDAVLIDGVRALDRMIDGTDPATVNFELDLAWAHVAGYDPLALARRMGSRLVSVHLKDIAPSRGSSVFSQLVGPGEGEMNYGALLPQLRALTSALPAVEVDAPADGLATAARAYAFVAAALRGGNRS